MKKSFGIAGTLVLLSAGASYAQEACSNYTVRAGDSLSGIANTAYGNINYQQIWDANRSKIGRNPNSINVGMVLNLPCADGTLPSTNTAAATQLETAPLAETEDSAEKIQITFVTGTDYPPYTDEDFTGGGIFTTLVREALATVESAEDAQIAFVNDWDSHMEVLLPSGAFDGTFPWVRPDCEADDLTENMQFRCDGFRFADPVYEIVTVMLAGVDDPLATTSSYEDFIGKNICIPEGYGAFVMSAGGIPETEVTYTNPATSEDCFLALAAGEVDVVEMELRQAADILSRLDLEDEIAANDQVNSVNALTVYIHKGNPDGDRILETINKGMENIRANGVWFQTVQAGFQEFYAE